jgi:PAS domain S-box-containing protein
MIAAVVRRFGGRDRLAAAVILLVAGLASAGGLLAPFDDGFADLRFQLVQREASGNVVVIGIDARSLRALDTWPWPRRRHAELLDRLAEAGARNVLIDVDFSARTAPEDDAALGAAIARFPGTVVLPAFAQRERTRDGALVETLPLAELGRAARLGSVNVRQANDGLVRRLGPSGSRPNAASVLAGRNGRGEFEIDYGIRADSVPRLSYVDVLEGRLAPGALAGKDVIVGAAAIELGDILPVPVYGNLPGPLVLALGYESLIQERAIARAAPVTALAAAILIAFGLVRRFSAWPWQRGLAALAAALALSGAAALMAHAIFAVALDVGILALTLLLLFLYGVFCLMQRQTLRIFRQSMEVLHRNAMIRSVVDGSFDAIVVVDHDDRITMFSPAAERLFGRRAETVLGKPLDAIADATLFHAALAGGRAVEGTAEAAGGECVAIEITGRRSRLRSSGHALERRVEDRSVDIYTVRDIGARKRVEEARRAAYDEAVAASRAKSEFLAAISHELRTPLNAIIGFSEILEGQLFGPLGNRKYVDYAGDIRSSGAHLLDIVNDLLDLARVEAGKVTLLEREVSARSLATAAARLVADRAREAGLRLSVSVPEGLPLLNADERLVKQVLVNLLSNAVKFTPRGGEVHIVGGLGESGCLRITITDNGIGIPPEQLDSVMKPFHQVDRSLARKYEGTGLGLPLARAFMELHGGTLVLDSAPGRGTAAICTFPAERTRCPALGAVAA